MTKLEKLQAFIHAGYPEAPINKVPPDEQSRLRIQYYVMQTYATVLGERIAHFGE